MSRYLSENEVLSGISMPRMAIAMKRSGIVWLETSFGQPATVGSLMFALVVLFLAASSAEAVNFTYLSQARSVSAVSFVLPQSESFTATDFSDFTESAAVPEGFAFHSSSLGGTVIDLTVNAEGSAEGATSSSFFVSFLIDAPVAFSLAGEANPDPFYNHATLTLREAGGSILYESDSTGPGPISYSGVFAPGSYELFTTVEFVYPVSLVGEDIQAVLTIGPSEAVPSMSMISLGLVAALLTGLGTLLSPSRDLSLS